MTIALALAAVVGSLSGASTVASTRHATDNGARSVYAPRGSQTLTKAEFITKYDALCSAASKAVSAVAAKYNPKADPAVVSEFVAGYAKAVDTQIDKTRALLLPMKYQSKITTMLQDAQTEINQVKVDSQLLGSGHNPLETSDSLARKFGLPDGPGTDLCAGK